MSTKVLENLEGLLSRNYQALGFTMFDFQYRWDEAHNVYHGTARLLCPCGGVEFLNFVTDVSEDNLYAVAENILSTTASREHLEKDVADGLLPPFDIDRHIFVGLTET
jgi:hypothetical protein